MSEAITLYVCCANPAQARLIAEKLLEAKLVACANILPAMQSLYHWQGKLEQTEETALLLKTQANLFAPCADLIRTHHSYTTPCIVAWPITQATPDYLSWLRAEVCG